LPADGRLPFPSIPSPGPSGPLAFRTAAVLACREVYQNILICQYILNQKLSGLLSNLEMSIPNILIMNKIRFCHTPFSTRHFFEHSPFLPFHIPFFPPCRMVGETKGIRRHISMGMDGLRVRLG
ncbi:MAG: hypothetical protein U0O39_06300, partial [Akkermansia sp.]